jgi:hypothetical protein
VLDASHQVFHFARADLGFRSIQWAFVAQRLARPAKPQRVYRLTQFYMPNGGSTTGWTVALLAKHLSQKYGCSISAGTLRRRMHGVDLCWKRPRYVYVGKDPNRAQKKGALIRAFLAADEVARNPAGMRTPCLGLPAH